MLSEKVTYTHTHKDSIFTFTRNPSKDKTSGTEYRSVGAWDWEWEEDISFKVTRGVFWVMEIFSFMNTQFIQWWYLCGMYISQNSSNSKIKLGEFYSVYIIFQYTSF